MPRLLANAALPLSRIQRSTFVRHGRVRVSSCASLSCCCTEQPSKLLPTDLSIPVHVGWDQFGAPWTLAEGTAVEPNEHEVRGSVVLGAVQAQRKVPDSEAPADEQSNHREDAHETRISRGSKTGFRV